MDRLDAMALLLCVVREGSLAAAARASGCSTATVSRAVALLEGRLGQRLLPRTARQLRLTPGGEVLQDLAGSGLVGPSPGMPVVDGRLGLTAPEMFGRLQVMPVLQGFMQDHPGVRARVLLLNRMVDLIEEGMDVAVRLAPLQDSSLVAVRLGELRRVVCATPDYLRRHGAPGSPADLGRHACIGSDDGREQVTWRFARPGGSSGRGLTVSVNPRTALNSAAASVEATLLGGGLYRALSYQVVDHLMAGRLVTVLDGFEPAPTPVHLVFHAIPRRQGALRAFVDYATPRLRASLATVALGMEAYDRRLAEGSGWLVSTVAHIS